MRLTLLTIMVMLCSSVNAKSNFAIGKYSGTGTEFNHVVTDLDLSNNNGLVLIKPQVTSGFLWLDTLRGPGSILDSTQKTRASSVTGFTEFKSDGFQIGGTSSLLNSAGANYEYLSFAEKTGFFDIVTYTGDQSTNRAIPHDLGDNVGFIIIKSIDGDHGGVVWHKALSSPEEINTAWMFGDGDKDPSNQYAYVWGDKEPTSNEFYVGASWTTNGLGNRYIAYVFADNPASGIVVGEYTGNQTDGVLATLPWQPDAFILKPTHTELASNWTLWSPHLADRVYGMLDRQWAGYPTSAGARMALNDHGQLVKTTLASGHDNSFNEGGKKYVFVAFKDMPGEGASMIGTASDEFTLTGTTTHILNVLENDVLNDIKAFSLNVQDVASTAFSVTAENNKLVVQAREIGTYSFGYAIQMPDGSQTPFETVTIHIEALSEQEDVVAVPDHFVAIFGYNIPLDILGNDQMQSTNFVLDLPSHSSMGNSLSIESGVVQYTPSNVGTDNFVYALRKGNGELLSSAIVYISVVDSGQNLPTVRVLSSQLTYDVSQSTLAMSLDFSNVDSCVLDSQKNPDLAESIVVFDHNSNSDAKNFEGEIVLPKTFTDSVLTMSCTSPEGQVFDTHLNLPENAEKSESVAILGVSVLPKHAMLGESQTTTIAYHNATKCWLPAQFNKVSTDFLLFENDVPQSGEVTQSIGAYSSTGSFNVVVRCQDDKGFVTQRSAAYTRSHFSLTKKQVLVGEENTLRWELPNIAYCQSNPPSNFGEKSIVSLEATDTKVIKWICIDREGQETQFSTQYQINKLSRPTGFSIEGAQ